MSTRLKEQHILKRSTSEQARDGLHSMIVGAVPLSTIHSRNNFHQQPIESKRLAHQMSPRKKPRRNSPGGSLLIPRRAQEMRRTASGKKCPSTSNPKLREIREADALAECYLNVRPGPNDSDIGFTLDLLLVRTISIYSVRLFGRKFAYDNRWLIYNSMWDSKFGSTMGSRRRK